MSKRVIVIEDDEDVFELVKAGLESHGCKVTKVSVASVAEAVVMLQDYDLFVVDLGLVGGNGQDVLAAINKAHPGSLKKIIVHTGADLKRSEIDALKQQCGAVIKKGVTSVEQLLSIAAL